MKRLILGVAAALILTTGQAAADGLPTRGKTRATEPETRLCTVSAEVGISTEKVIRGVSESGEDFNVLGGIDFTCGRFYLGFAGSSVSAVGATALIDISAGIRPKTGPITWDLGVIYHAYNNAEDALNYVELAVGASAEVWKGGTLGVKTLFAPEYGSLAGVIFGATSSEAWTVEGSFSQVFPNVGIFTPTFSATVGSVNFDEAAINDYAYWNVGLTLGFLEKWSLDLRYSDTDGTEGLCGGLCDERFTATLKYSF